jgi:hypothetical protein
MRHFGPELTQPTFRYRALNCEVFAKEECTTMRTLALTLLTVLLGSGAALAAHNVNTETSGRPSAILNRAECRAAWERLAGGSTQLSPVAARMAIDNFEQADTNGNGVISRAEFRMACKRGLVQSTASNIKQPVRPKS